MIKVFPSVLSADPACLAQAAGELEKCGADGIHFDVMDGHFVPNITFGPETCGALAKYTNLPIDVHLMVEEPLKWVKPFADAGAQYLSFHVETEKHIQRTLQSIKDFGMKAGVVLNPCTGLDACRYALPYCDLVLIMSVNPGFGGQKFIPEIVDKIKLLKAMKDEYGYSFEIEVDGGVNINNASLCEDAGATMLVAGSAVFHAANMKKAIDLIRG